jgi:hypothetical protein
MERPNLARAELCLQIKEMGVVGRIRGIKIRKTARIRALAGENAKICSAQANFCPRFRPRMNNAG